MILKSRTCRRLSAFAVALFASSLSPVTHGAEPNKENPPAAAAGADSDKADVRTRALTPPIGTLGSAKAEKPIVLIYYANESAPDAVEAQRIGRIVEWLRASGNAEIAASADGIKADLQSFPKAVDDDIALIQAGHAQAAKNRPSVVIFTNRLAREGKLITAGADRPGVFEKAEFRIPGKRAGLYQAYPLAAREVFEAALKRTAELYSPAAHEYVLITKSHGAPNLALTPKYFFPLADAPRDEFVRDAVERFETLLAARLKNAAPVYQPGGDKKLVDAQGRALVEKDGILYWEGVGKLQVTADEQVLYLADRGGAAFVDTTGKRVVVVGKHLRREGDEKNLADSTGQSIELLGALGRRLENHPESGQATLSLGQLPIWYPLVRAPLFAEAMFTEELLAVQVPEGGVVAIPKWNISSIGTAEKAVDSNGQFARFLQTAERLELPLLNGDELVAPIVPVGRQVSPLLAVDKWAGDSRLSHDEQSTMSHDEQSTMSHEEQSTMGVVENSASETAQPLLPKNSKQPIVKSYGVTKPGYVGILERQEPAGMFFRVLFLESCQSQLSADAVRHLRTRGTSQLGQVWSSDARGLRYSTCDYGRAFAALSETESFSEALSRTLQASFDTEQRRREAVLK